jgi:hypothetical protein
LIAEGLKLARGRLQASAGRAFVGLVELGSDGTDQGEVLERIPFHVEGRNLVQPFESLLALPLEPGELRAGQQDESELALCTETAARRLRFGEERFRLPQRALFQKDFAQASSDRARPC